MKRCIAAVMASAGALALTLAAGPPAALAAGLLTEMTWEAANQQIIPPPGWTAQVAYGHSVQVVTTPVRAGGHSVRFQLDKTDPDVQNSKRAELVEGTVEPATAERWYGFSIYLPTSSWQASCSTCWTPGTQPRRQLNVSASLPRRSISINRTFTASSVSTIE